jgi:hypothetical protein
VTGNIPQLPFFLILSSLCVQCPFTLGFTGSQNGAFDHFDLDEDLCMPSLQEHLFTTAAADNILNCLDSENAADAMKDTATALT